jgi:rare lipoprotein A
LGKLSIHFLMKSRLLSSRQNFLIKCFISCLALFLLSACSSAPKSSSIKSTPSSSATAKPILNKSSSKSNSVPNLPKANSGKGGYYQDDGPGEDIPVNLEATIDPIPVVEPYSRSGNKPYTVFGKTYTPIVDTTTPFTQRGFASWYGKKFHGRRTSSGEKYDMYKITAAHPTLPIPSYARVTNINNGKQIIVRINDRGPFHSSRVMDLSYTAALKLDYLAHGRAEVEIERLLPEDIMRMAENRQSINEQQTPLNIKENDVGANQAFEELVATTEKKSQSVEVKSLPVYSDTLSSTETSKGIYLQYAAFALHENATASLAKLQAVLSPYLEGKTLEVIQLGALYRIQSGPYANREQAQRSSESVTLGGVKPIIVVR